MESKMPGPDSTSTRSKIQSAILQTTGKIPIDKTALKRYGEIKKEFSNKMHFYLDRYQTGQLNISQLRDGWTAIVKDFFPVAYKNGLELGEAQFSYGKFDKAWVSGAIKQEL
ncbi:MAG: hypothetical protein NTW46_03540, partial [Candidatus Nealsonbacteria bacterium]|nr:hypothetical protein [Candidatus Nealsonbacteria bacterium]